MGKSIKMTAQEIESAVSSFRAAITGGDVMGGEIMYKFQFPKNDRKANLIFTEKAYLKMTLLIDRWDKEIAWHGVVFRGTDETKDEYIVTDILVYPQEVTGSTVNTDQNKYQMWLYEQEDDVFNNIRFQGHSHVRMAVTPSAVDENLYDSFLGMLDDQMFYIFGIWNKNNARTIRIYDMKKNIFFDNDDVVVSVIEDGTGIQEFLDAAEKMVVEKKYTPTYTGNCNGYNGNYGAYGSGSGRTYTSPASLAITPAKTTASTPGVKTNPVKKKKRVDPSDKKVKLYNQSIAAADYGDDYDDGEGSFDNFQYT